MKFFKEKKGIIISFIIGVILASGIVYAAVSASEVNYTKEGTAITNVEQALNDLYNSKKQLVKIEDISLCTARSDESRNSRTCDLSTYSNYSELSEEDFIIVYNGIAPALYGSNTTSTSAVYIQKSYNRETGILTVTQPLEKYNGVGAWIYLSVYLYH